MSKPLKPVIHFENDNVAGSIPYYSESTKLGNSTEIVSIEYDLDSYRPYLPASEMPMAGDTYVLDPFSRDHYIKLEGFDDYVLKQKQVCISNLALMLGAKSFQFTIEVIDSRKRTISADGKVQLRIIDANANFKSEETAKLNRKYSDNEIYTNPHIPDMTTYEKALEEAKRIGLYYDEPEVKSIIDKRDPRKNNFLGEKHVTFSLSKEINSTKDIAFNLNYFKILQANGHFTEDTEIKLDIIGHMDICF